MAGLAESVRLFFEARASALAEPGDVLRPRGEIRKLREPDDLEAVPGSVLEACGFYFLNVQEQDNGRVYVFRADAAGVPTFGVIATSDGTDRWLEVYGTDGALLGAGRMDSGFILWQDRDVVRQRVWDGEIEPELLAARERAGQGRSG